MAGHQDNFMKLSDISFQSPAHPLPNSTSWPPLCETEQLDQCGIAFFGKDIQLLEYPIPPRARHENPDPHVCNRSAGVKTTGTILSMNKKKLKKKRRKN